MESHNQTNSEPQKVQQFLARFKSGMTSTGAKQFVLTYKIPLVVMGVIAALVLVDYTFRSSSKNFYEKGLAAMQSSKYDDAINHLSAALRQNPADVAARSALGWAYHAKGWVDEALKQYEMANKSGAESLGLSLFNSGVIFQQKRRLDEAESAYQKAIALNPKSSNALYNLGFIYSDRGQNDLALQMFIRTMSVDPRSAPAAYNAGLMSERLGRKDDARKYFATTVGIDPNFSAAKDRLKALGN